MRRNFEEKKHEPANILSEIEPHDRGMKCVGYVGRESWQCMCLSGKGFFVLELGILMRSPDSESGRLSVGKIPICV